MNAHSLLTCCTRTRSIHVCTQSCKGLHERKAKHITMPYVMLEDGFNILIQTHPKYAPYGERASASALLHLLKVYQQLWESKTYIEQPDAAPTSYTKVHCGAAARVLGNLSIIRGFDTQKGMLLRCDANDGKGSCQMKRKNEVINFY